MADFQGTERFSVLRRLGEGGMGIVYEALDREQGVKVALKCLNASATASLLQLKDEFRSLRDVHHPNLVSLGELVEAAGQWFFTMELVEGTDLLGYLRPTDPASRPGFSGLATDGGTPRMARTGDYELGVAGAPIDRTAVPALPQPPGFDEALVRSTMAQLAQGLQALHDAGKIHRDVKPPNLLVTHGGRLVLSDFGLVTKRVVLDADPDVPSAAIGTPAYMAPELMISRVLEPASDWFSVGVVLYRVLVGWLPFQGTVAAMQYQKLSGLATPPRLLVRVAEDLEALCLQLLSPSAAARPNGREVLERLGVADSERRRGRRLRGPSAESPLFVGRLDEQARLLDTLRSAHAGPGELLVLQGESGVGKSSLARRFADQVIAKLPTALLLGGRCHERESVPYKAFDGVMDELTRHLREVPDDELAAVLPPHAKELARLFPVLAQLPALGGGQDAAA
ncbi:MAG: serine/threonine-protein kinase PknK, partial [Deltaproteobacteria bacterium]|nr:serine/threonine-protein kinase PknK [Deltaproteobacteria bacterium]